MRMLPTLLSLLANAAWQWPLIALAVAAAMRWTRPTPRTAYGVWLLAMWMALAVPAVATLRGSIPAAAATATNAPSIRTRSERTPSELLPVTAAGAPGSPRAPGRRHSRPRFAASLSLPVPPLVEKVCLFAWLATVLWSGAQLLARYGAASELLASAEPMPLPHSLAAAAERLTRRFQVPVPELRAAAISSPAVLGVRRPVLLLPVSFLEHTPLEQEAVLAHELAHLFRRDPETSLLAELLALPLRWHPATHFALRELQRFRERATDELAAAALPSPKSYAESLLSLAKSMLGGGVAHAPAIPLFSPDRADRLLEERIMQLVRPHSPAGLARRLAGSATALLLTGSLTAGAAAFPILLHPSQANTAAPATAPAAISPAASGVSVDTDGEPAAIAHGKAATALSGRGSHVHRWTGRDGQPFAVADNKPDPLAPQQEDAYEKQFARTEKSVREATAFLQSPEFGKQIAAASRVNSEEIQKQVERSTAYLRSPEFERQMAEASRVNSEAIRKQVEDATASLRSPEFRQQLRETRDRSVDAEISALKSRLSLLEKERDAQKTAGPPRP